MGRYKSNYHKKYKGAHKVIQRCHGNQRAGNRAGGLHLAYNRQRWRGRGGQRNAAENKGQINGGACGPEYGAEHQAYHKKSSQRFRDSGYNNLRTRLFHLVPQKLGANHQAHRAFQQAFCHIEPGRAQNGIA